MSEEEINEIVNRFTYHPPKGDQPGRYERLRAEARDLALLFAGSCPKSRELSLALTHLENAVFYANAAIARHE